MMSFAASALGLVTRLGPRAETDGALSELMEALAQELWAGTAALDAKGLFSTGDAHGADAAQTQQVAGHFEPVAVGAEGRQQSGGQSRPARANCQRGSDRDESRRVQRSAFRTQR